MFLIYAKILYIRVMRPGTERNPGRFVGRGTVHRVSRLSRPRPALIASSRRRGLSSPGQAGQATCEWRRRRAESRSSPGSAPAAPRPPAAPDSPATAPQGSTAVGGNARLASSSGARAAGPRRPPSVLDPEHLAQPPAPATTPTAAAGTPAVAAPPLRPRGPESRLDASLGYAGLLLLEPRVTVSQSRGAIGRSLRRLGDPRDPSLPRRCSPSRSPPCRPAGSVVVDAPAWRTCRPSGRGPPRRLGDRMPHGP